MRLIEFRVKMFKSVIDSGRVSLEPLTVVVGKNESGKTSVLKALHKLNPALAEPYRIASEWPRGHRESRSNDHVVCWATFDLTDDEAQTMREADPAQSTTTQIRVGRTYDGTLKIEAGAGLNDAGRQVLSPLIPKFVYMDEYEVFDGTAHLDQVKQRVEQNTGTPQDKALLTILKLAALDLQDLVKTGAQSDKTERQYDLSDGSATISKRLASHWKALSYEVQLEADGQQFFTFVRATSDKALIKLEERSRGFRWFFSFDAKLMHETKGVLQNCIMLLDEPGLHLHASAQRDLLARLEEYAAGNTMVYTTHLPFMINLHHPERIRVISDTPIGAVISERLTDSSPEAKLTLQAALGMTGRFAMPVGDLNLTVEGPHDYWYITALSDLMARSGKVHLPTDAIITACGGAQEVTYLSTFMVGQGLAVTALYDSDSEGRAASDRFVKNWLTRYNDTSANVLMLGEAAGIPDDATIEDLFPEAFYVKAVLAVYRAKFPEEAGGNLSLSPGGSLLSRIMAALDQFNIQFNKGSIAKRLCDEIRAMNTTADLPPEMVSRVESLFKSLTDALHKHAKLSSST